MKNLNEKNLLAALTELEKMKSNKDSLIHIKPTYVIYVGGKP